jgi:ABC-2 type transport system ATP-binding protein
MVKYAPKFIRNRERGGPSDFLKALEISGLTKVYSGFRAVDSISFEVEEGEVFGLLGPNGAGKTTTIKTVVTISRPTSGRVVVFGIDAVERPDAVREMVGYVPQAVSVDGDLTGYENLLIFSKLSYVSKRGRDERIAFALRYMGLEERAGELVKHYSGGMMRRLEIAQALVNRPRLLILDEPSIGLDPASKRQMWSYLKRMNREMGTTVLLTTHDMAEADELCDRIAIMNEGRIAVTGSPSGLKAAIGGDVVSLTLDGDGMQLTGIPEEIGSVVGRDGPVVKIATRDASRAIPRLIEYLHEHGVAVSSVSFDRPSLDDVFLRYAKKTFEEGEGYREARMARRVFARRSR